jgi:hypothetical protein
MTVCQREKLSGEAAFESTARAGDVQPADAPSTTRTWSAVGSMALCVSLLIAAEFMPMSLLTPIANDLGATVGMAGQAISISGHFAVVTSLLIATLVETGLVQPDQTRIVPSFAR